MTLYDCVTFRTVTLTQTSSAVNSVSHKLSTAHSLVPEGYLGLARSRSGTWRMDGCQITQQFYVDSFRRR